MGLLGDGLPVVVMLFLNAVAAVMVSLVKVAMDGGMNPLVLVTLQQLTASIFLTPIAYFKEEVKAKAHTGDLRLPLSQCCTRGSSETVHDLRWPALHNGHLRHRLLQHRTGPHLPPRRGNTFRSTEPEEQDGHGEAGGHADLPGRRHGADPVQGRGPHPRRAAASPAASSGGGARRLITRQVDAGHVGHPRELRLPLLLVPAPRPPRQKVPARLLVQLLHVWSQLPPGRRRWALHPEDHLAMDHQQQVPDPHRAIRWHSWMRHLFRAANMVHREEGASVRRRLHTGRADHRFSHRLLHPARAALPWKCSGICSCDWRPVSSAVGQEAGSLALSAKRS
ncbi:hypothetical protein QOZ80_6BG0457960 [Eleusine coracana subsp. coracana]|nr:hypothetical protein QOZ80_6BG0457960 [Eleusine coracana subsp. coracana]